jgi:hypothetical protein
MGVDPKDLPFLKSSEVKTSSRGEKFEKSLFPAKGLEKG